MNLKITASEMVRILLWLGLPTILALGAIGWILSAIPKERFVPTIVLPIMLLTGIIGLVGILSVAVSVFAALNLSNPAHAFGLPEGTIRAVIALGLILIFALMGVFFYGQLRLPETGTMLGLTQDQVDALPASEIISVAPSEADPKRFDVQRQIPSQASEDFAKQILTTVSTLVVAVAGFYFGSRAVATAKEMPFRPNLRLISPTSPHTLSKDTQLTIRLETEPPGLVIEGRVNGVEEASLQTIPHRHNEFVYKPLPELTSKSVVLNFFLATYPNVTEELKINPEAQATSEKTTDKKE
jgi:hypothetical protein